MIYTPMFKGLALQIFEHAYIVLLYQNSFGQTQNVTKKPQETKEFRFSHLEFGKEWNEF